MIARICIAGDRTHRSAKQQRSLGSSSNNSWLALRDCSRPENLFRTRHVGTERKVSTKRLSAFDWTSTIRKLSSILAFVPEQIDNCCMNGYNCT